MSTTSSFVKIEKRPTPITLSDAAIKKVAELISKEGEENLVLRVGVKPGGCSGYTYEMFFDTEIADDDIVSVFDNVKVVIDPASVKFLKNSTIDYVDELEGAGFHLTNPNVTKSCGCGNSFS
ncbi:MAG: iron-sulfur cluster insertion protein ErpA [Actinobacteria bacterium]|nr:iron-sulfur cluster insertion protein ErpA [Actinomycetota bacterium]MCL6104957.1 iron-sulfur cluster insertion protein ErpA [Actinomycetota bacterium]